MCGYMGQWDDDSLSRIMDRVRMFVSCPDGTKKCHSIWPRKLQLAVSETGDNRGA